ncbi:MAG: hypothetical protein C0514_08700 [Candidatus Puniceispirillum sp.]|nr:hypothetical protein [Candidatus Puniceispirillum sp.]
MPKNFHIRFKVWGALGMREVTKWQWALVLASFLVLVDDLHASDWYAWGWEKLGYGQTPSPASSSVPASPPGVHDASTDFDMNMEGARAPKPATPPPGIVPMTDSMLFVSVPSASHENADTPQSRIFGDPDALRLVLAQNRPGTPPLPGGLLEAMGTPFEMGGAPQPSCSDDREDGEGHDLFDPDEDDLDGLVMPRAAQDLAGSQESRALIPASHHLILPAKNPGNTSLVLKTSRDLDDLLDETFCKGTYGLVELTAQYQLPDGMRTWVEHRLILHHEFTSRGLITHLWIGVMTQRKRAIQERIPFKAARDAGLRLDMTPEVFAQGLQRATISYRGARVARLCGESQNALPHESVYLGLSRKEFHALLTYVRAHPAIPSSALMMESPPSPFALASSSQPVIEELDDAEAPNFPQGTICDDACTNPAIPSSALLPLPVIEELDDQEAPRSPQVVPNAWQPPPQAVAAGLVGLTAAAILFFGKY